MEQDAMAKEITEILQTLTPNRQRYLLELARASKKAEAYLMEPDAPAGLTQTGPETPAKSESD